MSENMFELISLIDIFANGNRAFIIPEYQRGYSWEKRQRDDLIKDLENLINVDYRHYTGTIVASKIKATDPDVELYEIVDGQQRLTTLVILLSVIKQKKQVSETILNEIQNIFIASGLESGNSIRKFSLNSLLKDYFFRHITMETITRDRILTKSHQNISDAFLEFRSWLDSTSIAHENIYNIVTKNLGFIFYAPKNDSEIGIMFEVINNRGKPLSELEKIKNYLIYFSTRNKKNELSRAVNSSWGEILRNLNDSDMTTNDDENTFLRNCWIVFADTNKSRSYHVYDNLKERYPADEEKHWKELHNFVLFLEKASRTYMFLFSKQEKSELGREENKILEYISLHASNASIMPLIISLYERENDILNRVNILDLLEKLNFRYYGCGIANRSDTGQGDLFWWAHKFYNVYGEIIEGEEEQINAEWLIEKLKKFIQKHAGDQKFVEYMTLDDDEDFDYYHWNNLRFFLANYEEQLCREKDRSINLKKMLAPQNKNAKNDYFHKEHIWAKKDQTIIEEEDNINKRRLGNFVLLEPSINISVSNDPVEKKVKDYFEMTKKDVPSTYMLYELKDFFDNAYIEVSKKWNRKTKNYWYEVNQMFLDIREEKLIRFALKRWKVDGLDNNLSDVEIDSFTKDMRNYFLEDK